MLRGTVIEYRRKAFTIGTTNRDQMYANHVLLLDASWRIDQVVTAQEVVSDLIDGRVVAASDDIVAVFHSPSLTVPVPAVVAAIGSLQTFSRRPPLCSPRLVRIRDRNVCQFSVHGELCTTRATTADHLHPESLGGLDEWSNMVAACERHNAFKAAVPWPIMRDRYGWGLRRQPKAPTRAELLIASVNHPPQGWAPFFNAA
jgi:5-methylcytosine-specific restriction endonuclease McrA